MAGFYDKYTRAKSTVMFVTCCVFTALILALLGLVTGYLITIGTGSLSWDFFTELPSGDPSDPGGMKHAIFGTLFLIGLASVVGILGYELVVRPIGNYNGWAGAFALAFIMIPIVARTTEEMLRLVPNSYREASIALGATKARTILRIVVPAATGSIVTGIMLAIARVAGETAPLLFTALGSRFLTTNPNEPFPSLTVQIFTYATGPYNEQKRLAWAGILVLISIIFVLNLTVRYFARSVRTAAN